MGYHLLLITKNFGMKINKLLGIIVLCLLTSRVYAESLGTNKTVNDYVNDNYTIISVVQGDADFVYKLRSNAKKNFCEIGSG